HGPRAKRPWSAQGRWAGARFEWGPGCAAVLRWSERPGPSLARVAGGRSGNVALVRRKSFLAHVVSVCSGRRNHQLAKVRVLLGERWHRLHVQTEGIVADQNLSIAVGTGTDADRRDAEFFGDGLGEVGGNGFQHE